MDDPLVRVGVGVVGVALLSAFATIWVGRAIVRLPEDHFVQPPPPQPIWLRWLRRGLGALLLAVGVLMLVIPGPGVLTMLMGALLLDGEPKRWLAQRLLRQRRVRDALNERRRRAGRGPLQMPGSLHEHPEGAGDTR
jgi:hypothetical protein